MSKPLEVNIEFLPFLARSQRWAREGSDCCKTRNLSFPAPSKVSVRKAGKVAESEKLLCEGVGCVSKSESVESSEVSVASESGKLQALSETGTARLAPSHVSAMCPPVP